VVEILGLGLDLLQMIWKTSKPEDQLVMTPILGSKKKQLNFRLNMEF